MSRVLRHLIFTVLAALVLTIPGRAQQGAKAGEWRSYAGDNGGTRYAPYDLITRDNVKDLQVARSWKFEDRKSTRLNSSHRCSSYAVFCLKKKRTGRLPQRGQRVKEKKVYRILL